VLQKQQLAGRHVTVYLRKLWLFRRFFFNFRYTSISNFLIGNHCCGLVVARSLRMREVAGSTLYYYILYIWCVILNKCKIDQKVLKSRQNLLYATSMKSLCIARDNEACADSNSKNVNQHIS
jgi:hypothetical protein